MRPHGYASWTDAARTFSVATGRGKAEALPQHGVQGQHVGCGGREHAVQPTFVAERRSQGVLSGPEVVVIGGARTSESGMSPF